MKPVLSPATTEPPSLCSALALCAGHLCGGGNWRAAMPQVLEALARASGANHAAWFEIKAEPAQAWKPILRGEWVGTVDSTCAPASHELPPSVLALELAQGHATLVEATREEAASCHPSLWCPVMAGGALRAILVAHGDAPDEDLWLGASQMLAIALERESGDQERQRAEDSCARREHLTRALLESTGDFTCAITSSGGIFYASPAVERALGRGGAALGASLWQFVHPDDQERARDNIRQAIRLAPQVLAAAFSGVGGSEGVDGFDLLQPRVQSWEMRLGTGGGSWRPFEVGCRSFLHDPLIGGLILHARDVSDHKAVEDGLRRQAMHDRLTGLPNRALFMDRLRLRVETGKRQRFHPGEHDSAEHSSQENGSHEPGGGEMFAVLFLDFDRFKVINDSLGHSVGDELLKAVARRLEGCLRPGDTVARLGGDEFAVLLHDIGAQNDALQIAERIQKSLGTSFLLEREDERQADGTAGTSPHQVFITASIGIALCGAEPHATPYENAGDVLRDADMAMYRSKEKGRARHEIFNSRMHEQAVERLQLETDLRRSLEDGDFRVHYQPIIALESGLLSGFEALVRWHHPRRGLVAPDGFLSVAEEAGLIAPLGWWVLRHACVQLRAWMDELAWEGEPPLHELTMSVNLCARQFASDDLADQVRQVLAASRLRPRNLKLEITESTLITQSSVAARQLGLLHEIGVQIGLDDFGTGYSSLSYLHRFSIDSLKIDRSFISSLDAQRSESIVSTILSLAEQLNLDVVAEGVETPEQAGRLREMRCPMGQGFYFSQPMPHEAAAIFMGAGGAAEG